MKRDKFLKNLGLMSGAMLAGTPIVAKAGSMQPLQPGWPDPADPDPWSQLRQHFLFANDLTYLNTGGIGPVPSLVMNHVNKIWLETEKHPSPGHDAGEWNQIRADCAPLFGPSCTPDQIALISCATEGINIILNGLDLKPGDEVISSSHEHPALNIPLLNQANHNGVKVKFFEPDTILATGNTRRIEALISPRTRLIFISHITCSTGQIFPLKDIGLLAKRHNILLAVDGAQSAAALPFDLQDLGVDFYTCSGHKWILGPKRTGILYVAADKLPVLRPTTVGAYSDQAHDIRTGSLKFQDSAQKYEFGTQNEALFRGLGKAARFVQSIGIDRIHSHNRDLAETLVKGLAEIPRVKILSPEEEAWRSSIISFSAEGKSANEISTALNNKRIRVRVVNEGGLDGIRVSFHLYNHNGEVDQLLDALREIL